MEREHRGWSIVIRSYECRDRKWRPIVTVSIETEQSDLLKRRLSTPVDWVFDTEQESDEQGYQLAVTWINEGP
jgi:hypothetical protein